MTRRNGLPAEGVPDAAIEHETDEGNRDKRGQPGRELRIHLDRLSQARAGHRQAGPLLRASRHRQTRAYFLHVKPTHLNALDSRRPAMGQLNIAAGDAQR